MKFFQVEHPSEYIAILKSLMLIFACYFFGGIVMSAMKAQIPLETQGNDFFESFRMFYGNNFTLIAIMIPWVTAFFGALIAAKFILKKPFNWFLTTKKAFEIKKIGVTFCIWTAIYLLSLLFEGKNGLIWIFEPQKFLFLLVIAFLLIPLQCLAEEIVFRSLLVKLLGSFLPYGWMIAVATGLIFGFLHMSNPEIKALGEWAIIFYIGAGLLLGFIVVLDDGIGITSGFHIANNLCAAIFITTNWQVFRTDALFLDTSDPYIDTPIFITMFGSMFLFFLIVYKLYNLKNGLPNLGKIKRN